MEAYIPIPTAELPLEKIYDFSVFLIRGAEYVLFREGNLPMESAVVSRLRENGTEHVFIHARDYGKYAAAFVQDQPLKPGVNPLARYCQEQFVPVSRTALQEGWTLPITLYRLHKGAPVPTAAPNLPGVEKRILPAHRSKAYKLLIRKQDLAAFQAFLQAQLAQQATYDPLNATGGTLLRESMKLAAYGAYDTDEPAKGREAAEAAIAQTLPIILNNRDSCYGLLMGDQDNFHTLTHAVNVSVLSMGLGAYKNLPDADLAVLGLGALLHDVGRRILDPTDMFEMIEANPAWHEEVVEHPEVGARFCVEQAGLDHQVAQIVAQHHECPNGEGFPAGLRNEGLPLLSRIVAFMEVYDSLTSQTGKRDAMTPFKALGAMRKMGDKVDQALLTDFVRSLGES
ncbi:HD-GYP domain-containing protein [Magnetofaba australis]|uniref:Putative metal dependent phosphohydrolase n=1 Tax=Magnetofaba australis IT-1 TaxID=1434232 RepID=A0A1Y2K0V9_9PROT|nr:HD domain-containing phosphohydrolase [Magnetofaba australis]OSM01638.1 putative metal dependent phosphohydrolase [Magnetofaba australis IT-1]